MLLELRAENYAVIDRAAAHFGPGLNLLTGETGAGKSILIDALVLLLGGKASADTVRHGSEKAVLACSFEATGRARAVLDENGIDAEGEEILLRREITAAGKGRVFVNNQPATVALLRMVAPELALVHAQGETLGAFDQAQQRGLLDRFAGVRLTAVGERYAAWRAAADRLEELQRSEADRLRMADLWRFQTREIADAGVSAEDEDARLEAEKRVLANAEKLYRAAMSAHELLYEGEHAAEAMLGAALKQVEELARYDARFEEARGQLGSAKATVEDVSATVRDFAEGMDASPERLAEIEDRLAQLDRLKRKYGPSLREVLAFGAETAAKLAEVEDRDALAAAATAQLAEAAVAFRAEAAAISGERQAAAARLAKAAEAQINELAMKVTFRVEVESREGTAAWAAHGWDTVGYRISTNAGEPLKPLEEIASGGEMSRVMLALKVTVEEQATAREKRKAAAVERTLVFDEIDIGIGGRAAEAVGRKLKALSRTQQVLCITHLPQIAAFADQHFVIEKRERAGRTQTEVRLMETADRTREIARMLSGAELTETSLRHAEQLMESSR